MTLVNAETGERQHTWAELRAIVLYRDCYTCRICGDEATEADHIIPRVLGGADELNNLQAACRRCNARKGTRLVPQGQSGLADTGRTDFVAWIWRLEAQRATVALQLALIRQVLRAWEDHPEAGTAGEVCSLAGIGIPDELTGT